MSIQETYTSARGLKMTKNMLLASFLVPSPLAVMCKEISMDD